MWLRVIPSPYDGRASVSLRSQTRIGMCLYADLVVFATAAPPRSVMNSRRFMSALKLRRRIVSV